MTITYRCVNCGKNFKPKDYMKLMISDDKCTDTSVPIGRKCDNCGNNICIDDKIVEM